MKTPFDPRHQRRRDAVKDLYAASFQKTTENQLAKDILHHSQELDAIIAKCAPQWPIDKLNRIDLAILRLATYELMVDKKEPIKVIIDEAIELAKEFGSESSASFVNGVLGAVVNDIEPNHGTDNTQPNDTQNSEGSLPTAGS